MYIQLLLVIGAATAGVISTDPDPPPTFSGKDVTHALFGDKTSEEFFPAAFGDFNADKLTDILTVSKNRSTLALYLAREEEPLFVRQIACDFRTNDHEGHATLGLTVVGVSVGDFNGDGMLDVLVTTVEPAAYGCVSVTLFAGNGSSIDCFSPFKIAEMSQEPLIVDVDGDMIMDLIGGEYHCTPKKPGSADEGPTPAPFTPAPGVRDKKQVWKFMAGKKFSYKAYTISITQNINDDRWMELKKSEYRDPTVSNQELPIIKPSSNAIVDIDGDSVPELLTVKVSHTSLNGSMLPEPLFFVEGYRILGVQGNDKWKLELFNVIPFNPTTGPLHSVHIVGQPMLIDLNQDGNLLQVLPYCATKTGQHPGFKVVSWGSENVSDLDVSLVDDKGVEWTFLSIKESTWFDMYFKTGLVYRVGDYNMDGYPDLMGVIMSVKGSQQEKQYRAVIFENVPCISPNPTKPCPYPRTFRIDFASLSAYANVTMATFFDIYDDGLIDVLLVRRTNSETHKDLDTYSCSGFLSNPDYDANYLKVMVTSGRTCPQCRLDGIPYGNIFPGPVIGYNATTQEGEEKCAVAAQMYRSSHLPLDLPYTIFGIGHSPNFIDVLEVKWSPTQSRKSSDKWTQIIPNSQVIVIPPAPPYLTGWKAKIFLPSTKAPLHTFYVLLGFCTVIGIIALILQWKERREDRKERLLETHRFMM